MRYVIANVARTIWSEPRAAAPPVRVWRDWVLVGVLIPAGAVEVLLRDDLIWKPLTIAVTTGLILTLLWRRTRPLQMLAIAFGTGAVMDVVAILSDRPWELPGAAAAVLLLPYALLRWGSGREAAIGAPIMLLPVLTSVFLADDLAEEVIGGAIVVLLAAALGAAVRFQANSRLQALEGVALREREQIARELHDTVAHHVSAIAIQAQAGRALAPARPGAATEALAVIEEEASRTLAEMRAMVGVLRRGEDAELAPRPGVGDIARLSRDLGGPPVHVELAGDVGRLGPALDAALFRLAQESVTNAVRHAREATRIDVRIRADRDVVRLTVEDDGRGSPDATGAAGFGLAGMRERAALLGGSLVAGPGPGGGWIVDAVLPRGARP